jgi:hypothetical protein
MMNELYIYVIFWSGILIAWSACSAYATYQIMANVHTSGRVVRRTDISNFVIITFTGFAQLLAMFIFTDWMVNLADTVLIANTWYTLYLGFTTYSSVGTWSSLCFGRVRDHSVGASIVASTQK